MSVVIGLESLDDFNEFHNRYWVHEMHTYYLMSSFRDNSCNLSETDGTGV